MLTFYQERIANEGYLPTAVERRSLLELARLIGYRLRPGVSASVRLAFTVANGFTGTIPAGTRAQSIPGTGQSPQFFETSAPLDVRDSWNALAPRLTRPQLITPKAADAQGIPLVTGADVIDTVYLDGIATNLKPGDAIFFVFGPNADPNAPVPQQYLRLAADVNVQAGQGRTEVTLGLLVPPGLGAADELQLYVNKAGFLFPGSDLAAQVVAVLTPTVANIRATGATGAALGSLLQAPRSRIALLQGIAMERGFTRVAAWLAMLLRAMQWASLGSSSTVMLGAARGASAVIGGLQSLSALPPALPASPLAGLQGIIDTLAKPPSQQPGNSLQLSRTVARSFAPQSDVAPRLLAALHPAAAEGLYQAWSALATPSGRVEVHAARVKAGLFAANWTGPATVTNGDTITTSFTDPTIASAWATAVLNVSSGIGELPLDATYDQIKPGSWVAVDRPNVDANKNPLGTRTITYHVVVSLRTGNVATGSTATGFAAKVTLLTLDPPWLSDSTQYATDTGAAALLRQTIVHAQSELLALAEEPLDTDIGTGSIDLAQVYDGIDPGRWLIVSGTRTDIPNVTGVSASELVMVGGISQGAQAPLCAVFPAGTTPFSQIYYTTDADAFGDRLVVGQAAGGIDQLQALLSQIPDPQPLNQQFCDQVELAPGMFANAYVPSEDERHGRFPTFAGLLVDPSTNRPFRIDGTIDPELFRQGLFAWRVSTQALHTVVNLAAPLAYTYDRGSVTIYGNVADSTHGQSTGEILGNGDATRAFETFTLSQSPLTYVSAATASGTSSTLAVRVNDLQWQEVDDLASAGSSQRYFVTRESDAQKTSVTFGNGAHGARVPTGTANVKAMYRYGIGSAGNVDTGQISQFATHPLGAQGVTNPLPASGGADPDTADQVRGNAPMAVMALDRLVSVSDYADFARTYAGIGKAVATRLSDGARQLVHLTIAGAGDIPIATNSDLYANLLLSLQTYGDPHQPVEVAVRRVRLIVMAATIGLRPDSAWENVAPAVRAAVLALFAFDARALGQTAFQSEAVAAAQRVAGVAWVNVTTFDGVAETITAAQLATLGATLGRRPFVRAELAHINPAAQPGSTNRIAPAELVFMTPDIPDTLILTNAAG